MDRKVRITIDGWKPWQRHAKSGIAINMDGIPDARYLDHLRLALKALYYHEERKVEDWQGEKFCKCETWPGMTLDTSPPLCGRCQKIIPPIPRWKDKPCQPTLIAAEIPDVGTGSVPTSPKPTQPESLLQSPALSAEKN
jgi:hypothetical protein